MLIRFVAIAIAGAFLFSGSAEAQLDKAERACASSKLKATGKKAAAKLKCHAKSIQKEITPTDPECLAKAEEKFLQAFAKAENKGGCVSEGDAAAVEANVDDFVDEEVARQRTGVGGPPPCASLGMSCGSCGTGTCVPYTGGGNGCANTTGAMTGSCMNDSQCPTGMHCFAAGGTSVCAFPCP